MKTKTTILTPEAKAKMDAAYAAEDRKYKIAVAVKSLRTLSSRAIELAETVVAHAKEIETPKSDHGMPVSELDRYTWAINEVENFIRNVNFAALARNAAGLAN